MHDMEKGIPALVVAMAMPIVAIVVAGGLFALLAFIAAIILFLINIVTVFLRPSRRKAFTLIFWSFLPLIIGLAGTTVGISGFKLLLYALELIGFGKVNSNIMTTYVAWFSCLVGGAGTAVNLIPAALNYVFSLRR